jgi:hypothetical protein
MLHYLKGLLAPALKDIKFLFCRLQNGISLTQLKSGQICGNKSKLHAWQSNGFLQLAKGSLIASGAIGKGFKYPWGSKLHAGSSNRMQRRSYFFKINI